MSEPFVVRKEVIVKEDGRIVILYSFERALTPALSPILRRRSINAAQDAGEGRESDKSQSQQEPTQT